MRKIQSRRPEKKAKNHVTLTRNFPWKSTSTTHLYFLPPNTKILKAFPKLIPPKLSQTSTRQPNCGEKAKSKPEILLSDVRTSEGDILRPEHKIAKCLTYKRRFGSYTQKNDQKTARLASKAILGKVSSSEWVKGVLGQKSVL